MYFYNCENSIRIAFCVMNLGAIICPPRGGVGGVCLWGGEWGLRLASIGKGFWGSWRGQFDVAKPGLYKTLTLSTTEGGKCCITPRKSGSVHEFIFCFHFSTSSHAKTALHPQKTRLYQGIEIQNYQCTGAILEKPELSLALLPIARSIPT